jgi:hypothetical protein
MTDTETANMGRILKHGMLAGAVQAPIRAAPQPSRFAGKVDLPLTIEDQDFTLSISEKNPQFEALREAFGPFPDWVGAVVEVRDGSALKVVNVRAIKRPDGSRVQA